MVKIELEKQKKTWLMNKNFKAMSHLCASYVSCEELNLKKKPTRIAGNIHRELLG